LVHAISVKAIGKRYASRHGSVTALDDVTFAVDEGEFVAVVGPSGCGKSTLLKILAGLLPATGGEAMLRGTPIAGPRRDIGVVFQSPVLFPWRSVLDNVLLPVDVQRLGRERHERVAMDLINLVGLGGFERRYPWELSGGMQQRVSLCRALIHEPALLMLDEPFAALDAFTREELWCVLRDLWQKLSFTVILVTHDLREAAFLADSIHVMSARPGRVVMTRVVDLPRPRDLDICYEPRFTDIVHELRAKIAEVRKA
jgi:NitT/TauT family transport system ATP-binding protein